MITEFLGQTPEEFFTRFAMAMVGVKLVKLYQLSQRKKESAKSPYHFDLRYYLKDNWRDIVLTILQMFVLVRFTPDLMKLIGVDFSSYIDPMFIDFMGGIMFTPISRKIYKLVHG